MRASPGQKKIEHNIMHILLPIRTNTLLVECHSAVDKDCVLPTDNNTKKLHQLNLELLPAYPPEPNPLKDTVAHR
jgi:hypothetical protein